MKRLYPWLLSLGLVGAGCSPESNVKPGAPVLKSITVVESAGPTEITGLEPACTGDPINDPACHPDMDVPLCRTDQSWCRCQANDPMAPAEGGHWTCHFEPTSMFVATFDRLLDSQPLDYDMTEGMPMGRTDVATFRSTPGQAPDALVDYASNGSEDSLIFKLFSGISGPRLLISGSPGLPSGSAMTLNLDKTKIRAKDKVSFFVSSGSLKDGVFSFTTAPFSVAINVPMAPPPDGGDDAATDAGDEAGVDAGDEAGVEAGAEAGVDGGVDASDEAGTDGGVDASDDAGTDASVPEAGDAAATDAAPETAPEPPLPAPIPAEMQPVTVTFNNLTDPAAIVEQITVMAGADPFTDVIIAATDDGGTRVYTVKPTTTWPRDQVITITVSADAADIQGVLLGKDASAIFVTEP